MYWLGKGGWTRADEEAGQKPATPGRPLDVAHEFELMRAQRPGVHAAYVAWLEESGLALAEIPQRACDCSGFVCCALGGRMDRNGCCLRARPRGGALDYPSERRRAGASLATRPSMADAGHPA